MRAGGESAGFLAAGNDDLGGSVRGSMAFQCACRGAGQLQRGTYFCMGGGWGKILAAVAARRGRIGAGFCIDELLSLARGLRATLGEYRAGAFLGVAARGQLPLYDDQ